MPICLIGSQQVVEPDHSSADFPEWHERQCFVRNAGAVSCTNCSLRSGASASTVPLQMPSRNTMAIRRHFWFIGGSSVVHRGLLNDWETERSYLTFVTWRPVRSYRHVKRGCCIGYFIESPAAHESLSSRESIVAVPLSRLCCCPGRNRRPGEMNKLRLLRPAAGQGRQH